ncbi:MAG: endonuclease VII domain-containing protein [Deltaproteobacteria bacterium]|nr:endonuclease VII domain-containing protein [Deltaproteobacteria bacterium]
MLYCGSLSHGVSSFCFGIGLPWRYPFLASDTRNNTLPAKGRKTTRPSCKECRVEIDGKQLRPEEKKRLAAIKPKDIFTCPICQKTSIVGITANFVIDHDHKTGAGREWICDSCNTGLGRFKDDHELIQRVIHYLKKYS